MNSCSDISIYSDTSALVSCCIFDEEHVVFLSHTKVACLRIETLKEVVKSPLPTSSSSSDSGKYSEVPVQMIALNTISCKQDSKTLDVLVQLRNGAVLIYAITMSKQSSSRIDIKNKYQTQCIGFSRLAPLSSQSQPHKIHSLSYIEQNQQFLLQIEPYSGKQLHRLQLSDACGQERQAITHVTGLYMRRQNGYIQAVICLEPAQILLLDFKEGQQFLRHKRQMRLVIPKSNQSIILCALSLNLGGNTSTLAVVVRNIPKLYLLQLDTLKIRNIDLQGFMPRTIASTGLQTVLCTTTHLLVINNQMKITSRVKLSKQAVTPNHLVVDNNSAVIVNQACQLIFIQL